VNSGSNEAYNMAALDETGLEPRDTHSADFKLQPAKSSSNRQLARRVRSSEVAFSFGSFRLLPTRRAIIVRRRARSPRQSRSGYSNCLSRTRRRIGQQGRTHRQSLAGYLGGTSQPYSSCYSPAPSTARGGRYFVNIPGRGYFFVAPVVLEVGVGGSAGQARADGYN
jgi:hypothetical protein